jgi:hypothetical protein
VLMQERTSMAWPSTPVESSPTRDRIDTEKIFMMESRKVPILSSVREV